MLPVGTFDSHQQSQITAANFGDSFIVEIKDTNRLLPVPGIVFMYRELTSVTYLMVV